MFLCSRQRPRAAVFPSNMFGKVMSSFWGKGYKIHIKLICKIFVKSLIDKRL